MAFASQNKIGVLGFPLSKGASLSLSSKKTPIFCQKCVENF